MERNNQLLRVLRILHTLLTKQAHCTIQNLSKKFNVNPKTIRRDLKAIKESPFGLESSQFNDRRRFFIRGYLQREEKQTSKNKGTDQIHNPMNIKK